MVLVVHWHRCVDLSQAQHRRSLPISAGGGLRGESLYAAWAKGPQYAGNSRKTGWDGGGKIGIIASGLRIIALRHRRSPKIDQLVPTPESGIHRRTGSNGSPAGGNGAAPARMRRRATAQSMAASQRDISVSEFFAKNRHLLGFDNPRKALLTTVKEAVDNALDACEEAGILPEIWVHIQRVGAGPLQGGRAGQRAGHPQEANPPDLRQAALRLEVPPPADEPRPAGHRHQRRRHARPADHRQAGQDHVEGLQARAGPLLRNPDRHQAEPARDPQRPRRGRRDSAQRPGRQADREARHRVDRRRTTARG